MVATLLYNGVLYRIKKLSGKGHRLETISLEVTHRCICRCSMCNIWKIPSEVADPDLKALQELLSSPSLTQLKEIDLTGGEPFLRSDIGEFIGWVAAHKPKKFPLLRTLSITTNGILTDRIVTVVSDNIYLLRAAGIDLVLACGMDGVGTLHDRIRGYPGAWGKLHESLHKLKNIQTENDNLILGIKTTIVPANVDELFNIADYADENNLFTIISPCIITSNRFDNMERFDDLLFSKEDRRKMLAFYQSPRFAWSGHRETMLEFLRSGRVSKSCTAGFNTVFVRHNGEVFPCPVIADSLGNLHSYSLNDLYHNDAATLFRKNAGRLSECSQCTEPGLERTSLPLEGFTLLRFLIKRGYPDYRRLVSHMGLDKYF